jgi:hypothetical protein
VIKLCIVTLKDGTTYNIDTNNTFDARNVVKYKLNQRLDRRQIDSVSHIKGVICEKGEYYNSADAYDGKDLKCTNGWSYKW